MPIPTSQHRPTLSRRTARLLVSLTSLAAFTAGCDRIAGTNAANIALVQKHFDSLAIADSAQLLRNATQDSLLAIQEVQRRTDSILRLTRPELGPAPIIGSGGGDSTGARVAVPSAATSAAEAARGANSARGVDRAPAVVPINPEVASEVQRKLSRARSLGDSIANAKVDALVGQNRTSTPSDSVRGTIQLSGSVPGTRAVLVAPGGANIALTGIGVEGLQLLTGADVVVRGMRVSPRDIVVTNYLVRAVKGIPVLDGRLVRSGQSWSIELSDKSGVRKLAGIPAPLQAAVGARVWIDANNPARAETYGIIARR